MRLIVFLSFNLMLLIWNCGCGAKKSIADGTQNSPSPNGPTGKEDAPKMKPDERPYYDAAQPFYAAIASRDYAKAFALLSSHAKARVSVNQFRPAHGDEAFKKNEENPLKNIDAKKFAELAGLVEEDFGTPREVSLLFVHSLDKAVLTGKSTESTGALDSMFAIGAMPDSIPGDIRKASLRGQIATELRPEQLAEAAKQQGVSPEELKKDPDFKPYFTLKVVLVEEGGVLKVGYFEFLPPSIMD